MQSAGAGWVVFLPEDEVSTIDLPSTAAVLEDASVAHYCALLKLRSVVGHILRDGRGCAQPSASALTYLTLLGVPTSVTTSISVSS